MENKSYRGGRPELPEEERSDIIVKVRFNTEEYNRLVDRMKTTKSPDRSKFIRSVCLKMPLPMKTQMDTFQDEALSLLVEMRADLLRIGVNINQSSKRINSTTDYHDLQRDVNSMAGNMSRIDQQLQQLMLTLSGESQPVY